MYAKAGYSAADMSFGWASQLLTRQTSVRKRNRASTVVWQCCRTFDSATQKTATFLVLSTGVLFAVRPAWVRRNDWCTSCRARSTLLDTMPESLPTFGIALRFTTPVVHNIRERAGRGAYARRSPDLRNRANCVARLCDGIERSCV